LREEYADDLARFIDDARRDPRYGSGWAGRAAIAVRLTSDAVASLLSSLQHRAPRPIRTLVLHRTPSSVRGFSMDALLQDIRFAVRGFIRRPAFTIVALLTLTIGIGANSAIFTLVNGVLLNGLPYPKSHELTDLWNSDGAQNLLISVPDFEDIRARNRTFQDIGIIRTQSVNLTGTEKPDRVTGAFSTAASLQLLGAPTAVGRLFTPNETAIGHGEAVVVLSYATWQNRFGGRPDILGQTLVLNGNPHVVIGVTGATFREPYQCDLWLPITSAPGVDWFDRANATVWGIGRLKPGVTVADAQRDVAAIAKQLAGEHASTSGALTFLVRDLHDELAKNARFTLLVLLGAVVAVLVIVCVNIANLQLVRASTRRHEMSLRAALGASRARLMSQVIVESLLLSLGGGVLGALAASWGVQLLVQFMPTTVPSVAAVAIDTRVVAFSFTVAVLIGLLFGVPAALSGTRTNLQGALRSRSAGASLGRFNIRNVLVVTELALCIVLLATATLFTRSLLRLQEVPPGFNGANVLTAEFRVPAVRYDTDEKILQFMATVLEKLRNTPGVQSAAFVDAVPLSGNFNIIQFVAEGHPAPATGTAPTTHFTAVSDGYFRTVEIPLVAGRDFNGTDGPGTEPVAIVNTVFAAREWPGQSAVGKTVQLLEKAPRTVRVIGVVGAVRQFTLSEASMPQLYIAKAQRSGIFASVVMKTAGTPDAMGDAMRAAVWSVDRDQPVWKVRSLQSLVDRDLSGTKFSVRIISGFAVLALLLSVIGVYGVMSFAVAQRTREVGIRMALGARGVEVLRLMLRGGAEVIAVAVVIGVAGAVAAGRVLEAQLFNVGSADPATMIGVPLVLASVALLACWIPARRAAQVNPAITLRGSRI
jgi:putative ABC transport system permease protein